MAETGVAIDAELSTELLTTIFAAGYPLHDGAVIVRDERIVAAGVMLPLADRDASLEALRHAPPRRAGHHRADRRAGHRRQRGARRHQPGGGRLLRARPRRARAAPAALRARSAPADVTRAAPRRRGGPRRRGRSRERRLGEPRSEPRGERGRAVARRTPAVTALWRLVLGNWPREAGSPRPGRRPLRRPVALGGHAHVERTGAPSRSSGHPTGVRCSRRRASSTASSTRPPSEVAAQLTNDSFRASIDLSGSRAPCRGGAGLGPGRRLPGRPPGPRRGLLAAGRQQSGSTRSCRGSARWSSTRASSPRASSSGPSSLGPTRPPSVGPARASRTSAAWRAASSSTPAASTSTRTSRLEAFDELGAVVPGIEIDPPSVRVRADVARQLAYATLPGAAAADRRAGTRHARRRRLGDARHRHRQRREHRRPRSSSPCSTAPLDISGRDVELVAEVPLVLPRRGQRRTGDPLADGRRHLHRRRRARAPSRSAPPSRARDRTARTDSTRPSVTVVLAGPLALLDEVDVADVVVEVPVGDLAVGDNAVVPIVRAPRGLRVARLVPETVRVSVGAARVNGTLRHRRHPRRRQRGPQAGASRTPSDGPSASRLAGAGGARPRGPGHAPLGGHARGRAHVGRHLGGCRRPRPGRLPHAGARTRDRGGRLSTRASWSRPRTTRPTTTGSRSSRRRARSSTTRSRTSWRRSSCAPTSWPARPTPGSAVIVDARARPRPLRRAPSRPGARHRFGPATSTSIAPTARPAHVAPRHPRRQRRQRDEPTSTRPDGIEHQPRVRSHGTGRAGRHRRRAGRRRGLLPRRRRRPLRGRRRARPRSSTATSCWASSPSTASRAAGPRRGHRGRQHPLQRRPRARPSRPPEAASCARRWATATSLDCDARLGRRPRRREERPRHRPRARHEWGRHRHGARGPGHPGALWPPALGAGGGHRPAPPGAAHRPRAPQGVARRPGSSRGRGSGRARARRRRGRVVVRASGTEPALRVMVEGREAGHASCAWPTSSRRSSGERARLGRRRHVRHRRLCRRQAGGPVLLEGLARLEYRGYDSAGIALVTEEGDLFIRKRAGKVADLRAALGDGTPDLARRPGPHALGHARATQRPQRPPAHRLHGRADGHPQRHHRELHRAARRARGEPVTPSPRRPTRRPSRTSSRRPMPATSRPPCATALHPRPWRLRAGGHPPRRA